MKEGRKERKRVGRKGREERAGGRGRGRKKGWKREPT